MIVSVVSCFAFVFVPLRFVAHLLDRLNGWLVAWSVHSLFVCLCVCVFDCLLVRSVVCRRVCLLVFFVCSCMWLFGCLFFCLIVCLFVFGVLCPCLVVCVCLQACSLD